MSSLIRSLYLVWYIATIPAESNINRKRFLGPIYYAQKALVGTPVFQLHSLYKIHLGMKWGREFFKWFFGISYVLSQTWRKHQFFSFHSGCRIFLFLIQKIRLEWHWLNINKADSCFSFEFHLSPYPRPHLKLNIGEGSI